MWDSFNPQHEAHLAHNLDLLEDVDEVLGRLNRCLAGVAPPQTRIAQVLATMGFFADDAPHIYREQSAFRGQQAAIEDRKRGAWNAQMRPSPCVYGGNDGRKKWPERFRPFNVVPCSLLLSPSDLLTNE